MLVFFMVAGTLAPPIDGSLALVDTKDLDGRVPPDALVIHADGQMSYRGQVQADAAGYIAALDETERGVIRLVPDRALPAQDLMQMAAALRSAGAGQILIVTERGLE